MGILRFVEVKTCIETPREQKVSRAASSSYSPVHVSEHLQVLCVRTRLTLFSYSSRFPTFFSFYSSSFNHSLSMHSLPNLEL